MDEARFRRLIAGETNGPGGLLARTGLRGLSVCYSAAVRLRNQAYDLGLMAARRAPVPVVSVGNLTTGGTGKTPLVAYLENWFRERGLRAGLLSRGYRALDGQANDEKLVLDQLCPGVPHLQAPDRVASARRACAEHGAEVLILDDGFQHRRLARDLDVVLIDCLNPWGYGYLLPRGLLREPLSALKRADLIVLTRADLCPPDAKQWIRDRLAGVRGTGECVEVAFPPARLTGVAGRTAALESLAGRPVAAFCGIGNPDGFRQTLQRAGLHPQDAAFRAFPDHHHYTPDELADLAAFARGSGAAAVLTTLKDLVKIERDELGDVPLWAVTTGTQVLAGGDLLEAALDRVLARCRATARRP